MGKSGKLFKGLVAGAFKSPFKEKAEKDKSAANADKNRRRKRSKQKCLWSLGKSPSQNQDSFAPEVAFLDAPVLESTEVEKNHGKDVPVTDQLFVTKPDHGPTDLIKAEDVALAEWDPTDLAKQEERAAIKIQTAYRRHLASHQDLPALRAVVRLQALVRGHTVRRHALATLRCIQALVKLQALARGRRVRVSELGQLIKKHLEQTKQRKRLVESWVSSMVPVQPLQAKEECKQNAVVKRQCALVYTVSEQLNKCETKWNPSSITDFQPDTSHWSWVWLERWMAAHPWGHQSDVTKEEHSKEDIVCIKEDVEVNAMNDGRDGSCLHTHIPSSNIKDLCSSRSIDDSISLSDSSPSATDKEAIPILVQTREDCRDIPTDLETAQVEPKSETEGESTLKRPLLSPPPPPPPPPPKAQRPKPIVAYQTSSHKGKQAAISANAPHEMPLTDEGLKETTSTREAEQLEDTCASTIGTHLESSSAITSTMPFEKSGTMEALHMTSQNTSTPATHLEPVDPTRSPVEDAIPSTLVHLSSDTSTTQSSSQSHPDSPLHAKHHISRPIPEASDLAASSASLSPLSGTTSSEMLVLPQTQLPISPATFSEMQVLRPHSHAIARSLSSFPDVSHDDMSEGAYTHLNNGNMDSTSSMVVTANGSNEGEVAEVSVRHGSVDKKDCLTGGDMDVKGTESDLIDCKSDEAINATPLSGANGGVYAYAVSAGEKSMEVSPGNHRSPVSKQGQHTETVSPPVPKYMTTTQSSQAKRRILTSPKQKSGSPKQKREPPKPQSETSKQKLGDSPKPKFQPWKQKVDTHNKQRLYPSAQKSGSPKQRKWDDAEKRRNSLSALEGKSSLTRPKPTLAAKVSWHI